MVVIVVRAAGAPDAVARSAVSLGMVALGIAAILQALRKGPIGSGYLAPPVVSAVYLHPSLSAVAHGGLALTFGMTVCAGVCEMVLSRLLPQSEPCLPLTLRSHPVPEHLSPLSIQAGLGIYNFSLTPSRT
jgi:NCS2 family nucleobase:cation symporter-2